MLDDSREPETRQAFRWMAGAVAAFCLVVSILDALGQIIVPLTFYFDLAGGFVMATIALTGKLPRFRLRTMMICVTLFCIVGGLIGNQVRIGVNRNAVRGEMAIKHGYDVVFYDREGTNGVISSFQVLIGIEPVERIQVTSKSTLSADEKALVRETFPEARIDVLDVR